MSTSAYGRQRPFSFAHKTSRTLLGSLTSPVSGHKSSVADTRRFALFIAFVFLAAAYAFVEERAARGANVRFYEEILRTLNEVGNDATLLNPPPRLVVLPPDPVPDPDTSSILDRVFPTTQFPRPFPPMLSFREPTPLSSSLAVYHWTVWDGTPPLTFEGYCQVGKTWVEPARLPVTIAHVGWYQLLAFPAGCGHVGSGPFYALIGRFRHSRGDEGELGVLDDSRGSLRYRSHREIRRQVLGIAGREMSDVDADYQDLIPCASCAGARPSQRPRLLRDTGARSGSGARFAGAGAVAHGGILSSG